MTKCSKCKANIVKHLWIVDDIIYCSPFCERSRWDEKTRKWTTRFHRYGDKRVQLDGIAGLVKKN